MGLKTRTVNDEGIPAKITEEALGHLAAAGVAGANDQHMLDRGSHLTG